MLVKSRIQSHSFIPWFSKGCDLNIKSLAEVRTFSVFLEKFEFLCVSERNWVEKCLRVGDFTFKKGKKGKTVEKVKRNESNFAWQ